MSKDSIRHVSQEDMQMVNKLMKTCSASRIIRDMKTETTVRSHLTLMSMATLKRMRMKSR